MPAFDNCSRTTGIARASYTASLAFENDSCAQLPGEPLGHSAAFALPGFLFSVGKLSGVVRLSYQTSTALPARRW